MFFIKAWRYGFRCRDTLGRNFIVEVQNYWQEHFFRRCAYYAARIYSYGVEKGDGQRYDVEPVFLVALLNASLGLDRKDSCWDGRNLSSYTFRELYTGQVEDDTIFITFVELYRFRRQRFEDCACRTPAPPRRGRWICGSSTCGEPGRSRLSPKGNEHNTTPI